MIEYSFKKVIKVAQENNIDFRTAAYKIALENIY